MYNVYQHWDPLKVCIVGKSFNPEFYSWIDVPHVRSLFERIAQETEEDYQVIIKKLQSFGVQVLRPDFDLSRVKIRKEDLQSYRPGPPMTPRDIMAMIGPTFYKNFGHEQSLMGNKFKQTYDNVKDKSWPECNNWSEFDQLPDSIRGECIENFGFDVLRQTDPEHQYRHILKNIQAQGNDIKIAPIFADKWLFVNGAAVSRIGRDLYFGTQDYEADMAQLQKRVDKEFQHTRNHIVNTGGHADAVFCPVCPGLIVSLHDVPTYAETFPGWEVVYLPGQSWGKVKPFLDLKARNGGKWWIPGFEYDQDLINTIETWLDHWVGYVEETVFDVNMLIVDPKNVLVFNYNEQVFDALERYGITPHIVPFRHRYFWDGGIHCVTCDLHREGTMQDWFNPNG